ncbi:MAG TPA: GNAT family N-acetyltransferase [Kofleriaceae bacterium]|nr:GNAT family N-acetyltransferase [Kofleriaceae bacterium]
MTAPVLETARLILRPHTVADLDDCFALRRDPEVMRYIGGKPQTREEAWMRVLRNIGHWAASGYGFWLARERATGRAVGEVGIADFRRDLEPPFDQGAEAGWVLATWAHGQGLATEAMTAVLAWADASPAVGAKIMCLIDEANAGSIRVAAKLGFHEVARTAYKDTPVNIYERVRPRGR